MDSDKKSSQALPEEISPTVESTEAPSAPSPRIPEPVAGIQINVCKTPSCENFGLPEYEHIKASDKSGTSRYVRVAAAKNHPMLRCRCCGVSFTMKSNQGVFEELQRIERMALDSIKPLCCTVETCENHGNDVALGKPLYSSFGTTSAGSPRYKCNACGKTFSTPTKSTHRQRESHKNKQIFTLLMNKMPLRRICEVVEVKPATVYGKIDFLYQQCLAFMASREARLPELPIERLYIGVDRQDYQVNWTTRADKRNVVLSAVGSVDNATMYCFGLHLNFDPHADRERVEHEAANHRGAAAAALRPHARLWLQSDYERSMAQQSKKPKPAHDVQQKVANTYASADTRVDIDAPDQPQSAQMLPARGMQVHGEYTLNAHFQHLRNLTAKAGKVRLFLDQDAGMRSAALTAFAHDIKVARRCDAFYVSIAKELTVDQKRAITRKAQKELQDFIEQYPELESRSDAILELIRKRLHSMVPIGSWGDRWLLHPLPSMSEPQKSICYLTNMGDYDEDHLVWLYNKASLHGIDNVFMQLRRRVMMLERGMHSQSNAGRVWNGYAAYKPEQIEKLLTIFRCFHNFIHPGEDKQTPAMRIGLAKGPVSYEDVLYFMP